MSEKQPKYLPVAKAAVLVKRTPSVVYAWIKRGQLKQNRSGKVAREDVLRVDHTQPRRAPTQEEAAVHPVMAREHSDNAALKQIAVERLDELRAEKVAELLAIIDPGTRVDAETVRIVVALDAHMKKQGA